MKKFEARLNLYDIRSKTGVEDLDILRRIVAIKPDQNDLKKACKIYGGVHCIRNDVERPTTPKENIIKNLIECGRNTA